MMRQPKIKEYQKVTTNCSSSIWVQAKLHDINWRKALEAGITLLLGIKESEEEKLVEEIKGYSGKITVLQLQLKELRKEKESNKPVYEEISFGGSYHG